MDECPFSTVTGIIFALSVFLPALSAGAEPFHTHQTHRILMGLRIVFYHKFGKIQAVRPGEWKEFAVGSPVECIDSTHTHTLKDFTVPGFLDDSIASRFVVCKV